jgi:hypothetical protein
MNTIYQYFTEPNSSSSSNSSKKSSPNSVSSSKKQVNSPPTTDEGTPNSPSQKDQQYQEALRDLKISWIPK